MAKGCSSNNYEEARKQRVEENKKRFEDLGISKISKILTKVTSPAKKSQNRLPKLKLKTNDVEPRRSSRPRNQVRSYTEDFSTELLDRSSYMRKRSRSSSSSWESYAARPLDEIKQATEKERRCAYEAAEALQIHLQSSKPSFIKSMVRSHVYTCFWLGLPNSFCVEHLPKTVCNMTLEDEDGSKYDTVYIGRRSGLSGGWKAFALAHKLDDGDALVFELVEPARLKIYIVRAFPDSESNEEAKMQIPKKTNSQKKMQKTSEVPTTPEPKGAAQVEIVKPKTRSSQKQMQKMSEVSTAVESKEEAQAEAVKRKAAAKLSNKKQKSKGAAQVEIVKPKTRSSQKQMQTMSEVSTALESKEGNECKTDLSINTEQLLPKDNVVETVDANASKKKEHVKENDLESTKDKPDEKPAPPKFFRKKPAPPKFFRKRV